MHRWMLGLTALVGLGLVAAALTAAGGGEDDPNREQLRLVTDGISQPTNVAFDRKGRAWITSSGFKAATDDGVWFLPRRGVRPVHVVSGLRGALGLVWFRGELFVSSSPPPSGTARGTGRVTAFAGFDGRRFTRRRVVVGGIPTGLHTLDSLAVRRDGRIFLGVGSQTDSDPPTERLSATVISFPADGSDVRMEARGLRNPYGLAFLPDGRTLAITDNGRDDLGPDRPPDELNVLDTNAGPVDFGHPACFSQGGEACEGKRPPRVLLPAHAAAAGVAVARRFGTLGPNAFVALFGSTSDERPTGGEILRVPLHGGQPGGRALGFAPDLGRQEPLGLAIGPHGALYVTLWKSGRVMAIDPPRARE